MNHYSYRIFWSDEDDCYFAVSPEFPRLSAFGDTPEDALREFQIVLKTSIELYKEEGWPLPEPTPPVQPESFDEWKAKVNRDFDLSGWGALTDTDDAPGVPLGAVPSVAGAGTIFDDD